MLFVFGGGWAYQVAFVVPFASLGHFRPVVWPAVAWPVSHSCVNESLCLPGAAADVAPPVVLGVAVVFDAFAVFVDDVHVVAHACDFITVGWYSLGGVSVAVFMVVGLYGLGMVDPFTAWVDGRLKVLGDAVAARVAEEIRVEPDRLASAVAGQVLSGLGELPAQLEGAIREQFGALQSGLSAALVAAVRGLFSKR